MTTPILVLSLFLALSPALTAPVYALKTPVYALKAPVYALKAPVYALKAPVYALKAPAYALKAPAYTLKAPAYALKAPAYRLKTPSRANAPEEITIMLAQAGISEGQAASIARSQYGGKVLSVSKSGGGDRVIYRVKLLLDSGRVIIVTVDGQTGRVSG